MASTLSATRNTRTSSRRLAGSICLMAITPVTFADTELQPELLESRGALIGEVIIDNGSIFDLDDPEEDGLLYRLANKLHITTRPHVIEQQLLFEPGDNFSVQALEESERILRDKRFIQDAQIEPIQTADGEVDVKVSTTDTWSLTPKLSFSHTGGVSSTSVGIKDRNLFGSGAGLELEYRSDVDRDSTVLKYKDWNLGDSWHSMEAVWQDNSDGYTRMLQIGKPFYALDSTLAYGATFSRGESIESLYDRGEIAAQYGQASEFRELFYGWSKGLNNGWTRRYTAGFGHDERRFSEVAAGIGSPGLVPLDRKLVYPFVGMEIVQDKYEELTNIDQIARVEDRFMGTALRARVGAAREQLGSDRDALLINVGAETSFSKLKGSTVFLSSDFASRIEAGGLVDTTLAVDARYYHRQSDKRLFFAKLSGTYGHELDLDHQLYLGGDNGLRGYPLRYQNGDKRALLTLEQRFYTDWYPFRLFRVGAAVFFDAGRTWGDGPFGTGNDGLLRDVGAGLRLGNMRSSLGRVIHVDVAYPLDGGSEISNVQFIVELKQSF